MLTLTTYSHDDNAEDMNKNKFHVTNSAYSYDSKTRYI